MRTLPRSAGTDVAAQCFLNALLRETKDWRYLPATVADELSQIHIPLSSTRPFGFRYAISHRLSIISITFRRCLSSATATAVTPSLSRN